MRQHYLPPFFFFPALSPYLGKTMLAFFDLLFTIPFLPTRAFEGFDVESTSIAI